jgi:hypothetical protein
MKINKYYVEQTKCYPNAFKVINDHYRPDNATINFFPSYQLAEKEAARRNDREKSTPSKVL